MLIENVHSLSLISVWIFIYLSPWVVISFSRASSRPRDRIHISCYADGFFTTEPPRKPFCYLQFSSVAQSCSSLCDPMDCTILGLPVHHQCPELTQTHVHCIGDSIQLSHLLSSPSPPAFNHPSMRVISWVSSSHQVAKVLEFQFQHQSFQWIFRTDFL